MGPVEIIVVFSISWWLIFLMVLPFGVRRTANPEVGHARGAPERGRLGRKALLTTGLTVLVTVLFYWAQRAGVLADLAAGINDALL